ncbi:ATP-binding protein [Weissella paramesenteroides]|uniref:ATP-binding protein n=1 Tax=Weissella paramesenteroides TaxID=1249 RepID=UPI0018DAECEE|nr:AAA family ATPase [Weissella paramesenteroides]QPI46551.1 AAA family ATPase [Weissella paramesenteroides]
MWIKKVHIVGFGQFNQQTFDFVQGLQVVQGLNEAGKTTLHQFLFDMIFGFPQAKGRKINTYEPLDKGPYGGSMQFEVDHQLYELERLGRTQTVTTLTTVGSGQQFADPEAMLTKLLGPVDRELYLAIFSFDQEALMNIFSLKPDDFAAYLRTLATPGAQNWLEVANRWDKTATAKFGSTKTAHRELNQALANLQMQRQQLQNNLRQQPSLDKLQAEAQHLTQRVASLEQRQAQLQGQMNHQQAQVHLLPVYRRWQQIKQQVKATGKPLDLTAADKADRVRQQLTALDDVMVTTAVTKQQVESATVALRQLEKLENQQKNLAEQQVKAVQAQTALLEKYHWTQVPPLLTDQQKSQLGGQKETGQQSTKNSWLIIAIIISSLIIIGALLISHVAIGILLALISLLLGWWGSRQQKTNVVANTQQDLPAAYQQMATADIFAAQTDIQRINDMMLSNNQIIHDQQAMMSELVKMRAALNWLGEGLTVDEYRKRLADIHIKQETMGQQQLQRANLQQTLQELYQKLGVKDVAMLQQRRDAQRHINDLQREANMLEEQLKGADLHELAAQAAIATDDKPAMTDQQTILQRIQDEKNQLNQKLAEINVQLQNLQTDNTIEHQQQVVANQVAVVNQQLTQYFVDRLGSEWIKQALNVAIADRLPNLLAQAGTFLRQLTDNHYQTIQQTKTLLKVVRNDGKILGVNQLSKGTAEQLYVALRLAFVKNVTATLQLPLLIDDAFVDFDEQRRQTMLTLLADLASSEQQIFYFTAQKTQGKHVLTLTHQQ